MKNLTQKAAEAYEQLSKIMHAGYEMADREWLMRETSALADLEAVQTFPAYERAARYTHQLLLDNGFDSELLTFPADGKTVYQDMCMPLAWDATVGRLTVKSSSVSFDNPVIADFEKLPIHLVKHSIATPEGGITTRVVTEAQMMAGEDCTGAMVLLEAETRATSGIINQVMDLGAIGFISEYLTNPMDKPDDVYWANAATDRAGWHVTAGGRDFIGFQISPRNGRKLRQAATYGSPTVLVESDGRRYEGDLHAVTALIPGKQKKELWMLAHTCEPFAVDDCIGVVGSIGVVKTMLKMIEDGLLPPLEFSIRLVFAMEVYGFAAVVDHFGGTLVDRAFGGINMDMMFGGKFNAVQVFYAPLAVPFYGNFILKMVSDLYNKEFQYPHATDMYLSHHDDMFLGDATIGLPTVWPLGEEVDSKNHVTHHHNSSWTADYLDEENYARAMGYYTAWTAGVACMNADMIPGFAAASAELAQGMLNYEASLDTYIGEPQARMTYLGDAMRRAIKNYKLAADVPEIDALADSLVIPEAKETEQEQMPWLDYADKLVPTRLTNGLPFDRTKAPHSKRKALPGSVIYSPFSIALSNMDGKKTLKQVICEASWERHTAMTDKSVKDFVTGALFLGDWGYLSIENPTTVTKPMIVQALKNVGVKKGDVLLVHSGLSYLGHVDGGAETLLDALIETVGEDGTILLPVFTRPYIAFEGSLNKSRIFRPACEEFQDRIFTGAVPKALLHRPGTKRSAHATHAWCGVGKMADYCLSAQTLLEPPASENSPMAKALELGGKVVFIGSDIHSNTFLHYLEDKANAPYLENAVVKVKDADGKLHTEVIHKHLPGHRSFYGYTPREGKFYKAAFEKGLQVAVEPLGFSRVQMMDLKQLDTIGMELFREDPLATLCDSPTCAFCRKFR